MSRERVSMFRWPERWRADLDKQPARGWGYLPRRSRSSLYLQCFLCPLGLRGSLPLARLRQVSRTCKGGEVKLTEEAIAVVLVVCVAVGLVLAGLVLSPAS